ncbi:hypothetical protein HNY73_016736 [Argiope bruennichi]|uniref:Uncharacterized protein n=1 Tax=Argiope bruennichi TaxID=94029 RepID=A0A8T0EL69_ARGBR|nr:hypothetical protein HNY73_016736 [Argiope bruennichi]
MEWHAFVHYRILLVKTANCFAKYLQKNWSNFDRHFSMLCPNRIVIPEHSNDDENLEIMGFIASGKYFDANSSYFIATNCIFSTRS